MEKPFYEFDLASNHNLITELEELYSLASDVSNYTKLIFRGPEREGFVNTIKSFETYDDLVIEHSEINNWIERENFYIGQLSLFGNSFDWKKYPLIYKFIIEKIFEIYGSDIIVSKINNKTFRVNKFNISDGLLTMYKKGGRLSAHQDGKSPIKQLFSKPANILLYLNKEYKREWGGNFIVDETEVIPSFGKLVFLNFKGESDPMHEVSIVKEDINRIAILFNVTYSNSERIIWNIE